MTASRFEHPSAAPMVLMLPDIGATEAVSLHGAYWQDAWSKSRVDCAALDVGQSARPDRNNWVTRLDQAIRKLDAPVVLVGHGAGALAIAWWAALLGQEVEANIVGALLVAPYDPADAGNEHVRDFAPLPTTILPFPSLVVASETDPTVSVERSFSIARQWGSGFARFGACGHFGADDGLGWWTEGEELLDAFIELIEPGAPPLAHATMPFLPGWTSQSASPWA